MDNNLETRMVDSARVLITEHNFLKRENKELYVRLYGDTCSSVRTAIESGNKDKIPSIVALQNPFSSVEETVQAYQEYVKVFPRRGGQQYEHEEEILRDILNKNVLLCYNGNRRLEEFQKAGIPIKSFVITSQGEYEQVPAEEKRIHETLKDRNPSQYRRDKNYVLSYLGLLDDVVYIGAEKMHFESMDTGKLLMDMNKKRRGEKL